MIIYDPKPGQEVDLYVDQGFGKMVFDGRYELIRQLDSSGWRSYKPFPVIESCQGCHNQINGVRSKWLVRSLDPMSRHTELVRYLTIFYSIGTLTVSEEDDYNEKYPDY